MNTPLLLVNFKTYPNASGNSALELARLHDKISKETGISIAIAVQAIDLRMIASEVSIPVLSQHFDLAEEGSFTGHVTPYSIKAAGAKGSLLNHSEKKLSIEELEHSINLARELNLITVVCADSPYTGKAISELTPDFIAVEPPELIGGDISVCTAEPQVVQDAVKMIGKNKVLVGAGVKTAEDVRIALQYGAAGVLVSSGVAKVADPEKALYELVKGMK